ncbi:DNA ligase 1-like [Senna tora]|uniref:DNA ligase 1-like n=1 Tax=Senna tora TaxID=362788 RepID=A0A834SGH3_9FABA|nr:DNA ligase 1-like [Senna tora]
MSFLNCINVCHVQLVPNAWVYLRGFKEACESVGGFALSSSLFYFFHVHFGASKGYVLIYQATSSPVILSHLSCNVHDWDGWFMRITVIASFHPFWLRESDRRPLFPLYRDNAIDVPSFSATLDEALGVSPTGSISPRAVPGTSRRTPCPGKESVETSKRPQTRQRAWPFPHLSIGDMPYPSLLENILSVDGQDEFQRESEQEGLSRTIRLFVKLLYEALLSVRRVNVLSHSSEVEEALAMKSVVISEMLHMGFGHSDPSSSTNSGLKKELVYPLGAPPGFSKPACKIKDDSDRAFSFLPVSLMLLLLLCLGLESTVVWILLLLDKDLRGVPEALLAGTFEARTFVNEEYLLPRAFVGWDFCDEECLLPRASVGARGLYRLGLLRCSSW